MAAGPSCSMPARQSAEYYYDRFVDKCSALGVSASEETLSILKEVRCSVCQVLEVQASTDPARCCCQPELRAR
eukprot:scaffold552_cov526-Prasinococcus_capsulatus_cf.AAC.17